MWLRCAGAQVQTRALKNLRGAGRLSPSSSLEAKRVGARVASLLCVVVQLRAAAVPGEDTSAMKRARSALAARAAVEEDMMQRVALSKDERRRLKGARRSALSGGAMLDDFADDVAGIVAVRSLPSVPP